MLTVQHGPDGVSTPRLQFDCGYFWVLHKASTEFIVWYDEDISQYGNTVLLTDERSCSVSR